VSDDLAGLAQAQEQTEAIRDAASRLLATEWPLSRLREQLGPSARVRAEGLWKQLCELEWHRVLAPDAATGVPELCVMAEEIGRVLAPVPFAQCAVGLELLESTGRRSQGGLTVLANREEGLITDPFTPSTRATRRETGFRLDGSKLFVPWGDSCDAWIVSARVENEDGVGLFRVAADRPGVTRTPLAALDWWPLAELRFAGVELLSSDALALGAEGSALLAHALDREILASCAELVGVASGVHEMAVEYAKQRVAFDRPIGAFQAVKHRLVDLRADIEIARALVSAAAHSPLRQDGAPSVPVARAAFWCADALRRVPEGAIQIFGGIGYTWDHDAHLYLRRAATLVALLGERATYRERIMDERRDAGDEGGPR
jgi:alkylation response protein AidB-like acyl-CoA dehydrogenase